MSGDIVGDLNRELNDSPHGEVQWICVQGLRVRLSEIATYGYHPDEDAESIYMLTKLSDETVEIPFTQELLNFLDNYFKVRHF